MRGTVVRQTDANGNVESVFTVRAARRKALCVATTVARNETPSTIGRDANGLLDAERKGSARRAALIRPPRAAVGASTVES
jgi:hypothetical protein